MSPTRAEIERLVLAHLTAKDELPADADLTTFDYVASGHVDSMGMIRFVLLIEEKLGIALDDAALLDPRFRTVGGLIDLLHALVTQKK